MHFENIKDSLFLYIFKGKRDDTLKNGERKMLKCLRYEMLFQLF